MRCIFLAMALSAYTAADAVAQDSISYRPVIHGTVRAKYELRTCDGAGRIEVRNARISVSGDVARNISYKAEVDLSDEGAIKMLDAYVAAAPARRLSFTVGQMRVPFTIDAHRSPHRQYFANRSFIAKQVGNVRDVGVACAWSFGRKLPLTVEGGIFNGSGLTAQKDFWTKDYNFSLKTSLMIERQFNITLSCQRAVMGKARVMMYDAGAYWQSSRWHMEAEYLRKYYAHGDFDAVDAVDAFVVYKMPLRWRPYSLSFLGRYDYMSDHSKGIPDDNGRLTVDDPCRHRLTGGLTLGLVKGPVQADLRLNYEQYFYRSGAIPAVSEQSKFVVEFVAHF